MPVYIFHCRELIAKMKKLDATCKLICSMYICLFQTFALMDYNPRKPMQQSIICACLALIIFPFNSQVMLIICYKEAFLWSETLKTSQNVLAWSVSWPHNPACTAGFGRVFMMIVMMMTTMITTFYHKRGGWHWWQIASQWRLRVDSFSHSARLSPNKLMVAIFPTYQW